ncbi:bifunctional folylpolyglutamate synthase/dihydrofolate synthase [Streptococcus sp. zg-86]|uniref:tetrahydrofolate synthase n=1 Tax=Streptococcus zhangguiae TaxID=2664091 RepID=A0A6I4R7Q9_9STRE|nr:MULTISPECIES: folylpolyglutamate synthase/dihydrofolate synthase family protein [unclassified Streptococcus]MTB63834.1 bifunctional folylpolyglutamate synthase/dihydrofolate synthase [Streptococcus sp. zg-86]MTB90144.1 bifunctional folylpolyglutamate synthase/dihydrofolate synthase [Streptococcus sp. zg-36]MWV55816.1 bifunctional folylpolyglutamate synthase/dihydrofolate synthase [Streptococcus sp. zg-70]QTH47901.1 bifunctional folylpolyglutamate synthase/dihydrofolate synthase [Streptococcu
MNYQEALVWLLSQPKVELKNGVERVKWLLGQLGHPEQKTPAVHFVGTNGKGSTLNALQSILIAAGYRVGRFTSPSILDYREQLVSQEKMISEDDFAQIVSDLLPLARRLPNETVFGEASEFELLVVVFFIYIANYQPVDIVLVEAGMGGLLDATNVLRPLAVVCPSIGLDHQSFLGETHQEIAEQKVGVLKERVPLIYASDRSDVCTVFEERARQLQGVTYALGREFQVKSSATGFDYLSDNSQLESLHICMHGQHQYANAALAIQTAELLQANFPKIDETAIRRGLSEARWPGRIEFLRDNLVIDGAHNNEGVAALCQFLQEQYPTHVIHFLFAAINTKPVDTMLKQLENMGDVTVTSFSDDRAVPFEAYPKDYPRVPSFTEWLETVDRSASNSLYVITGSLYFISGVRKYILEEWE